MVLVRRIHERGANIVVEANGEVLFSAEGDVGRWTSMFSKRVVGFAAAFAPVNKRPRWAYYGKPLKSTLTGSTTYHPARMKVYSAVGSTSPHAYYVDQGTGIYAGNAPYQAKILPPWEHGSPSLYEHTWIPPGARESVAQSGHPVMIRGQQGQFFLDAGLRRGFESMRMRSFQLPGEGAAGMSKALSSFPEGLANFIGNTPADAAFMAQLEDWRAWRDAAYNSGRVLGRNGGIGTRESVRRATRREAVQQARRDRSVVRKHRRALISKERSQVRRDKIKAMNEAKGITKRPRTKADPKVKIAQRNDRANFLAAMLKKYGVGNVERNTLEQRSGYWYITVRVPLANRPGRFEFKEVRAKSKT